MKEVGLQTLGVCCGCTLLCDDVTLQFHGQRLLQHDRVCGLGVRWATSAAQFHESAWVAGQETTVTQAAQACLRILQEAKRPMIAGLNLLSVSAQGKAVALGRSLRALVDVRLGNQGRQAGLAFQQAGRVTATLGEVRQRADVILFWNADPGESHPRLLERFCAGAKKWIFLQSGKSEVGAAAKTDDRIQRRWLDWGPERRDRFLASLLVDGLQSPAEDTRPSQGDGSGDEEEQLRNDLKQARYLTVFYRSGDGTGPIDTEFQSLTRSVREMNGPRRAVLIPLRRDDNGQGAENALAAECGFSMAVDFASGFARSHWLELSASSALQRGEVDVAMVFVDHRTRWQDLQRWSPQTKWLIWHTDQASQWNGAAVSIPMSVLGIDQPGDATRNDDFLIPVDCLQGSARGKPDELLSQMLQELTPGKSKGH